MERGASEADIKTAYRKLALKFHPDRNPDDRKVADSFYEASEAYSVLSNPQTRTAYDRFVHAGSQGAGGAAGFDPKASIHFSDFVDFEFGDTFGGGGWRGMATDPAEVPRDVRIDNVHFTLTGPSVLPRGIDSEIQFWVHLDSQRNAVIQCAKERQGLRAPELSVKSEGPVPLRRGARISIRLRVDGLECLEPHKWITWTGEIGTTTFILQVAQDAMEGSRHGIASIRLNGLQIAKMSFVLLVGAPRLEMAVLPSEIAPHRSAFACYASEDRREVLARVQGMEVAYKGLAVFVDVIDFRSAEYWESALLKRIAASDVFYLFWCRHAKKSDWVQREWQWALEIKGLDFIDPVPLETPQYAPPPDELAAKHFNDPLLAFIAPDGGHSPP